MRLKDAARSARWFSVMADECTDVATIEQMAICIRFIDHIHGEFEVREDLIRIC